MLSSQFAIAGCQSLIAHQPPNFFHSARPLLVHFLRIDLEFEFFAHGEACGVGQRCGCHRSCERDSDDDHNALCEFHDFHSHFFFLLARSYENLQAGSFHKRVTV